VKLRPAVFLLGAVLLGGCAAVPKDPVARAEYREADDPLEPMNRRIFAFNEILDKAIIRPVAKGYVKVIPKAGRDGIKNFVSNLNEPLVFANNILQGQFSRAGTTAGRFVFNTTFGVGGVSDYAGRHGLPKQTGDLGQTFHVWGFPEGPYLMLPLFGPSNPRDGLGQAVTYFVDPYRFAVENNHAPTIVAYGPAVAGGVDERARALDPLDAIRKQSVDFYASLRSFFRQNRAAQLRGDTAPPAPGPDNFYEDPGAVSTPEPANPPKS
jgi:phospholipid-binding lipoprotein MlaA